MGFDEADDLVDDRPGRVVQGLAMPGVAVIPVGHHRIGPHAGRLFAHCLGHGEAQAAKDGSFRLMPQRFGVD